LSEEDKGILQDNIDTTEWIDLCRDLDKKNKELNRELKHIQQELSKIKSKRN
jgi:hypothetical protein